MRVAVLGAGITGACVALELADAGCEVDLYDRADRPLSRASLNNEGKLHLGLVYAKDATGRTAETMIRGAVSFRTLVTRWMAASSLDQALSTPFIYAVPRDSMLPPENIRRHFDRVSTMFEQASRGMRDPYVGAIEAPFWSELATGDFSAIFDPDRVTCAFTTIERAVDPTPLCEGLRAALTSSPRLGVRCLTEVESVEGDRRGRLHVRSRHLGQALTDTYDTVVNALWEQRLAVDASFGIDASRPVVHRYKVGMRTHDHRVAAGVPSVTFVLGPFGDTVAYPHGAYTSWYPAGLVHQEFALRPRASDVRLEPARQAELIERSLQGLRALMPGVAACLDPAATDWEVVGGYITAWGTSGIDDSGSELHLRYAVGVSSYDNYHSIDTGKLTLGPLFAAEACARILARGTLTR